MKKKLSVQFCKFLKFLLLLDLDPHPKAYAIMRIRADPNPHN